MPRRRTFGKVPPVLGGSFPQKARRIGASMESISTKPARSGTDPRALLKETHRVNMDFPKHFLVKLDREAELRAVSRQALIKTWLYERLHFAGAGYENNLQPRTEVQPRIAEQPKIFSLESVGAEKLKALSFLGEMVRALLSARLSLCFAFWPGLQVDRRCFGLLGRSCATDRKAKP